MSLVYVKSSCLIKHNFRELRLDSLKETSPECSLEGTDIEAEAEAEILWPPHKKRGLIGKEMLGKMEIKRRRGQQRTRW